MTVTRLLLLREDSLFAHYNAVSKLRSGSEACRMLTCRIHTKC